MSASSSVAGETEKPVEARQKRGPNYKLLWPLALGAQWNFTKSLLPPMLLLYRGA